MLGLLASLALGPLGLDWLLLLLPPLHPQFSLYLALSTCASVPLSPLNLGMVPKNRFGLEMALGAPLGLAGLSLLGPATSVEGLWPCEETELVFLAR